MAVGGYPYVIKSLQHKIPTDNFPTFVLSLQIISLEIKSLHHQIPKQKNLNNYLIFIRYICKQ